MSVPAKNIRGFYHRKQVTVNCNTIPLSYGMKKYLSLPDTFPDTFSRQVFPLESDQSPAAFLS